jgi:hypothetical protein
MIADSYDGGWRMDGNHVSCKSINKSKVPEDQAHGAVEN